MCAGSSSLEGWEFGRLPRLKGRVPLPAKLPFHLGELLRVQPALLQQLSTVKLRILAKAYRKVYPKDGYNHSEDTLYNLINTAIKVCHQGLLPVASHLWESMVLILNLDGMQQVTSCAF